MGVQNWRNRRHFLEVSWARTTLHYHTFIHLDRWWDISFFAFVSSHSDSISDAIVSVVVKWSNNSHSSADSGAFHTFPVAVSGMIVYLLAVLLHWWVQVYWVQLWVRNSSRWDVWEILSQIFGLIDWMLRSLWLERVIVVALVSLELWSGRNICWGIIFVTG